MFRDHSPLNRDTDIVLMQTSLKDLGQFVGKIKIRVEAYIFWLGTEETQ